MQSFRNFLGALLVPVLAATGVTAYATPASAQYNGNGNSGVADVSVANGGVVIVRGDSGTQVPAALNAPVVPGDYIATSSGSNAEVQFDGTSMVRLANNTQVRFVNLTPNSREIQLAAGTIDVAELQGANGSPQIDTPSLSVRPTQAGDYRVTVLGNGRTLVTVRNGAAAIDSANGTQTLTPGSTLVADGSSIGTQSPVGFDSFDQFNNSRDQSVVSSYNSSPYLSPQLAGSSNFGNYGQWQNVPGYGYAWAPNNQSQSNFAPYQNGQWVWEPGYGYTWVDNAPYGYATSHYGTWFNKPSYGGWLWQPPAYQNQNSSTSLASAWLPAVVSFFLTGNNGGLGGGLGNALGGLSGALGSSSNADIGWIPLAPGEQYQPWYGQNSSYPSTGLTNVTNVTNLYNYYGNARYYRGVTTVPVSAWRNGDFRRRVVLRPQQLKQIVLVRGAVPVVPTTANLRYSRAAAVKRPIVLSRSFAAQRFAGKAPVASRIAFKTQQERVRSSVGARPKIVQLAPRAVRAEHPVYRPSVRAPIHLTAIKPVPHLVAPIAKPAMRHAAGPLAKPAMRRPEAPVAKPATHRPGAPLSKPVTHPVAPLAKPALNAHRAATLAKPLRPAAPVTHPVAPVAKPLVHRPVAPVARPVAHPVVQPVIHHPVAPVAQPVFRRPVVPVARPVTHPVAQPMIHRPVAPVARPVVPVAHPVAPVARPAMNRAEAPVAKPAARPRPKPDALPSPKG